MKKLHKYTVIRKMTLVHVDAVVVQAESCDEAIDNAVYGDKEWEHVWLEPEVLDEPAHIAFYGDVVDVLVKAADRQCIKECVQDKEVAA